MRIDVKVHRFINNQNIHSKVDKKKVCIITAARSEYGLLRWIIDGVYRDSELELQLVVTGSHLSDEQGQTVHFIEEDGYPIAARVDMHLTAGKNKSDLIRSMGYASQGMADVLDELNPDIMVVLGDRYELIPIVSAALMFGVPVAHASGGDVTKGAIDDEIRNAITMMATLHFPGTEESANNIRRMRMNNDHVYMVGECGLDNFLRYDLMSREELAGNIGLDVGRKWFLVTLHPETRISVEENLQMAKNLFKAMNDTEGVQYVISKANADYGGSQINSFWDESVKVDESRFLLFSSLGQRRYLSFMRQAAGILGNSSSGIVESPFLGIPVVNIGDRQKGRYQCANVIQCGRTSDEIKVAIGKALAQPAIVDNYFGDGHTAENIIMYIKKYLNEK